jgi:hypothetical protein
MSARKHKGTHIWMSLVCRYANSPICWRPGVWGAQTGGRVDRKINTARVGEWPPTFLGLLDTISLDGISWSNIATAPPRVAFSERWQLRTETCLTALGQTAMLCHRRVETRRMGPPQHGLICIISITVDLPVHGSRALPDRGDSTWKPLIPTLS